MSNENRFLSQRISRCACLCIFDCSTHSVRFVVIRRHSSLRSYALLRLFTKFIFNNCCESLLRKRAPLVTCCMYYFVKSFDVCQKMYCEQRAHTHTCILYYNVMDTGTCMRLPPTVKNCVGKSSIRAQLESKHTKSTKESTHSSWRSRRTPVSLFSSIVGLSVQRRQSHLFFAFSRWFRVERHRLIRACSISQQQFMSPNYRIIQINTLRRFTYTSVFCA